jgi:AcrR family transcriptional regulator
LTKGGAAEISIGDVARAAGVSKALVHYHFRDKESLLCALVEDVGFEFLSRAHDAAKREGSAHVLDDHWSWVSEEIRRGDLRILLSLAEYASDRVRAVSRRIADRRREVVTEQVATIFERLELTPRVSPSLMAETVIAFIDGLAASTALEPDRDPRPGFDVLWLALITLAE